MYTELEQKGVRSEPFPSEGEGSVLGSVTTQSAEIARKIMPVSESAQSLEDVMLKDERNGELVNANSSEIIEEEDEIVQIPLNENEDKKLNMEVAQNDDNVDVALTDAPLVGAPFRLISFVARYVSGADLVNKNSGK